MSSFLSVIKKQISQDTSIVLDFKHATDGGPSLTAKSFAVFRLSLDVAAAACIVFAAVSLVHGAIVPALVAGALFVVVHDAFIISKRTGQIIDDETGQEQISETRRAYHENEGSCLTKLKATYTCAKRFFSRDVEYCREHAYVTRAYDFVATKFSRK